MRLSIDSERFICEFTKARPINLDHWMPLIRLPVVQIHRVQFVGLDAGSVVLRRRIACTYDGVLVGFIPMAKIFSVSEGSRDIANRT